MGSSESNISVICKTRNAAGIGDKVMSGVDAHAMGMEIPFVWQAGALPDHHGTNTSVRNHCHKA